MEPENQLHEIHYANILVIGWKDVYFDSKKFPNLCLFMWIL